MRLVLCDAHRLLIEALSAALSTRGWTIEAAVSTPSDAVRAVDLHEPDMLVIDVAFPDDAGLDAIRTVVETYPETKVVVLTGSDEPELVREALDIGVAGYTRKDQSIQAIGDVLQRVDSGRLTVDASLLRHLAGKPAVTRTSPSALFSSLTPREQRVLKLLVDGRNTADIVMRLRISDSTARTHVQSILSKLGVHSRLQAVALLHGEVARQTQRDEAATRRMSRVPSAAGARLGISGA
ncbi:MAG TPA: response regulator transcription factor [Nocardioidaceae bacterium]|nr:response regulator transcription factor [Nocardioidaceae bacterium]